MQSVEETSIITMMRSHFKDDHESFAKIDKAFEKQTEIANQNAEHFSYFNQNLKEIRDLLDRDAEETTKFREFVMAHTKRVEPVIKAYEDEKIAKAYMDAKSENFIKLSKKVGAISIIGAALLYILRKTL